jgi:predicted RNA polymerase sigma factor
VLEDVFRDEWGRLLASLVGFLRDFDEAEEAAQEAFAIARSAGRYRECRPIRGRGW